MKTIICLAAAILAVNALSTEEQWMDFKAKHGKNYTTSLEEKQRYEIFLKNLIIIKEHNAKYDAGLETYFMGVNQFADMSSEEFKAMLRLQRSTKPTVHGSLHVSNLSAPATIDWRNLNAVSEVRQQGTCQSCWAFSAVGALEGQNAIVNNVRIPLSQQQLLDCSGSYGNGNCLQGGNMQLAFEYVTDYGIEPYNSYPYVGEQGACRYSSRQTILRTRGYNYVQASEAALKNVVGTVGPVSVAVYSGPIQLYQGGIFRSNECYNSMYYLDHGVLVVGYGNSPSDYWIIKNSWGPTWGENGYFRLARNANQCGVALDASYPVV